MNLKEIREIINLMNENDLTQVEIEREGTKIKISKAAAETMYAAARQPLIQSVNVPASIADGSSAAASANSNLKEIASPMVGTFYRSPSPESPSFIEVGQTVEVGRVVCIVEAMKLMNEIKSEVKGKIVSVEVDNGQPVEFGQTLFTVEPI